MSDQGGGGSITLERLFQLLQEIQVEQRQQRTEQLDMRSLLQDQVKQGLRTERHLSELREDQVKQGLRTERNLSELREDLELMLKARLMGRLGYLETQIGYRFDELSDRIGELEGGGRPPTHRRGS